MGVKQENRVLRALTIGEIADVVKGKIINNPEKSGEPVENYMLGAMVVGSGVDYFIRKNGKAAIIRHDRLDMQMAALETPTKCLVLSGSPDKWGPSGIVLQKAISHGVPVIATEVATNDIITGLESALVKKMAPVK